MDIREHGDYTTIHRDDGKIVLAGKGVYEHIGLHGKPGNGSVFSGGITPDMINNFLFSASIQERGGGLSAKFPGGGYLLVAPFESAMKLQDATVKPGHKDERGQPVEIAAVHTTQPITDFETDETTVLVFPYDEKITEQTDENLGTPGKTNAFISSNPELSTAKSEGRLFALATAFPGGWEVEGQKVPKASEWGGVQNPSWAVIIPDSTAQPMIERWKRLAGTL